MDWLNLKQRMVRDRDMPRRSFELLALSKVRDGTQYDHLDHAFADEKTGSGEYVKMSDRRPSAKSNMCRLVVDDSVSLLFSEYHFPRFCAPDERTLMALELLKKHSSLNAIMIDAVVKGSIGSVAIWLRVLRNRPYFSVLQTMNLTPEFDPEAPDTLQRLTEMYKVDADDLIVRGYDVAANSGQYWFKRVFDTTDEIWYLPKRVAPDEKKPFVVDTKRSLRHNLGFCPIHWQRNLPGGDDIDGAATFANAIDTVIELDYLVSQGGRGLKYASDPTLVIEGDAGTAPKLGGSANALVLESGSAKLLEITGGAANAVLEHVKFLREQALEAMHGSKSSPERAVGAQSGRALEMLHQGLVWLSDKLRISYGEGALLALARMICDASAVVPGGLLIGDQRFSRLDGSAISLRWPEWFEPTAHDILETSQALGQLVTSEVISRETATSLVAEPFDIEDVEAERVLIDGEIVEQDARLVKVQAQVQAKATITP